MNKNLDHASQCNRKAKAVIVCGPTASGKTGYAHSLALDYIESGTPAEIVNCDSMQIYRQIPIVTASPEKELCNQLPYHLYNFKSIEKDFSVAEYVDLATDKIQNIVLKGALPIIVGGTGMYVSALIDGINHIPSINPEVRAQVRDMHSKIGSEKLHEELSKYDEVSACKLNKGDSQRIMRALEVIMHTGKSICEFQNQTKTPPMPNINFQVIMLSPPRELLYENCNSRLIEMFNNGAIEEIDAILKSGIEFGASAAKALAIPQIISYLHGNITKSEALEIASAKTRQYAKRQTTWFNNQITDVSLRIQ